GGMGLEPRTVSLDEETNPELENMSRRFWMSLVLASPLVLLVMAEMIPGLPVQRLLSVRIITWVQVLLATPVAYSTRYGCWWTRVTWDCSNRVTSLVCTETSCLSFSFHQALEPGAAINFGIVRR